MKPNLRDLLEDLQRELRLQDWRISVEYVRNLTNRAGYPVHGLCSHMVDAKVATIQIRDPETPATQSDPPVEETLVHELVHLHFAPFSGSSSAEIAAEEQAVWALTEALHGAKTAARRGQIARAMVARAAAGTAPERMAERSQKMDLVMLMAAMKAASQAEDPKAAIEALIKELEGAAGGGAPPPPPESEQGATPEPEKMQAPEEEPKAPMARRAVTREEFDRMQVETIVHQHGAKLGDKERAFALTLSPTQVRAYIATQTSGAPAPASATHAAGRAASASTVSRVEFERFRVDQLLTQHGSHLSDAQRKFAAGLAYDQLRAYLAQHPADAAKQPVERRQAPTRGGATADDREARRARLGLSGSGSPIVKTGNVLQLGAMTREQAIAHRERAQKGAAK